MCFFFQGDEGPLGPPGSPGPTVSVRLCVFKECVCAGIPCRNAMCVCVCVFFRADKEGKVILVSQDLKDQR